MKLDKNVEEKWLKEVSEEKTKIVKEAYSKLDDLYELLRELTELKDLKFESVYKEEKNTFDFESENIAKRSHLLEIAWKEMVVTTFGVGQMLESELKIEMIIIIKEDLTLIHQLKEVEGS